MGGNSFENTSRLSESEYCAAVTKVLTALDDIKVRAAVPPALQDKASHGDVDVLVVTDDIHETTKAVYESLGAIEFKISQNQMGQILSKDRFQIDLILANDVKFDLAVAAKSHGRFTHLLNMALKKQALSMTDEGLQISFTKERKHVLSIDLNMIAAFFGFPGSVFDGKTRFTCDQIVDIVFQCRFFDIRRFTGRDLAKRNKLLGSPLFARIVSRMKAMGDEEHKHLSRDVDGENKAGRIAAKTFGFDFDRLKAGDLAKVHMTRKLHGGFFVALAPKLRQHKDVLKRMPRLLLESVAGGDWVELKEWCEQTSTEEKQKVVDRIFEQAIFMMASPSDCPQQRKRATRGVKVRKSSID